MTPRAPKIAAAAFAALALALGIGTVAASHFGDAPAWTEAELAQIQSLSLADLPPLPADPSNRVADDPNAARLGEALFFDVRLSANGKVACANCHLPQLQFQDGLARARGVGTTARRSMPIAGMAYSAFLFWDGRKDSLWSQALGPLESAVEHGGSRTAYAHLIAQHYRDSYEAVFGELPNLHDLPPHAGPVDDAATKSAWVAMAEQDKERVNAIFANIGKAIAAFERRIVPSPTRFDRYAAALAKNAKVSGDGALSRVEAAGLRLFIGKAICANCHYGPLFTDGHFHHTGVAAVAGLPEDLGRSLGAVQLRDDPFNCLGPYSDASLEDCSELRFMTVEGDELVRAYKTPSLRGAASRAPYMHAGQIESLAAVIDHYNNAPTAPAGHSELQALSLTEKERNQLAAFLQTIDEED